MLAVETSKHKFLFTVFLFTTPVVVVSLSRQIVSHHLFILKAICLKVICAKPNLTYCSSQKGRLPLVLTRLSDKETQK